MVALVDEDDYKEWYEASEEEVKSIKETVSVPFSDIEAIPLEDVENILEELPDVWYDKSEEQMRVKIQ